MPKVSVIIPVYNVEKYLQKCLDSVVNQTLKDIEIICVNDGSTDRSLEILRSYANTDSRIKVISKEHKSAGVARNIGLRYATGEFIHFLDSDDWLEKDAYECTYSAAHLHNVDVCMFSYNKFDNVTKEKSMVDIFGTLNGFGKEKITRFKDHIHFFVYTSVVPWNKIYRRIFIIENQFYFDDLVCANDRAFYFRVIPKAKNILLLNQAFVNYRVNNKDSLVGETRLQNFKCHFEACENIIALFKADTAEIRSNIWNACMCDIFYFYHKAHGDIKWKILRQMQAYFKTLQIDDLQSDLQEYSWYVEFDMIRAMDWVQVTEKSKIVPIVFATNDHYAPYLFVALMSLIENASIDSFYDVYIFYDCLSQQYRINLKNLASNWKNVRITCVDVSKKLKKEFYYSRAHYSKEMYYRLLIAEILYQYDKVLYLDCDLIVCRDVADLYRQDINDNVLGAVFNLCDQNMEWYVKKELHLDNTRYFNSGVLLINTSLFIEKGIKNQCIEKLRDGKKLACPDQDVLNMVCQENTKLLDDRWNFQWQYLIIGYLEDGHIVDEKQLEYYKKISSNAFIVHYTTGIKPWNSPDQPLACYFWNYARQSIYYEKILYENVFKIIPQREKKAENLDEIQKIQQSWSYKIGRFITFIPRKIRGGIRCYQEHGIRYTLRRLKEHLHI